MERAKKVRKTLRASFTKSLNKLNAEIAAMNPNKDEVTVAYELLRENAAALEAADKKVFEEMIDNDSSERDLEDEAAVVDEYKTKYVRVKVLIIERIGATDPVPVQNIPDHHINFPVAGNAMNSRNFKLPTIELKKFSGDIKDWLQFWSQFKKIHEDATIGAEDKFQYLLQAMTPGSRASELVQSFPPTSENYEKVITSLKSRFGRDALLVEVYVRELLKLVLQTAMKSNEKPQLATLYDKLESHMRALETLGVTSDKCAAMLYPLVESSLPEDLLRAWKRGVALTENVEPNERLTKLLKFIGTEAENEERIAMAVMAVKPWQGFQFDRQFRKIQEEWKNATRAEK